MAHVSVSESEGVTRQFLKGFSLLKWPNLSATRRPCDDICSAALRIPHIAEVNPVPEILTVISLILGTYCGVSDILLAIQLADDKGVRFVRVSWGECDTWADVTTRVNASLMRQEDRVSMESICRILDIGENQAPCLAFCRFSSNTTIFKLNCPLTFVYDIAKSTVHLSSSKTHTHPSISHQILAQMSALVSLAQTQPDHLVTSSLSIPPGLISIHNRAPDDEILTKAYSSLAPAPFVTDYLSRRAIASPQSTAVRWYPSLSSATTFDDCESITYVELDKQANRLARWMRKMGLKNGDRVAVCMNRDLDFHASLIAIMRSGGCYVPIDPELPMERKSYIALDSNALFVLTSGDISHPSLFGDSTIFLDSRDVRDVIQAELDTPLNFSVSNGLAFLLYTSGTTGNPKGCLLTHNGLSQALLALSSIAADVHMEDLTQGRYLAVASIAFDVHLAETFVPLVLGMSLHSAPRSQLLENLPFFVQLLGITHLGIVPSLIEATMGAVDEGGEGMALRYIASGGEKMSDLIMDKWANHPQVRLANFYGPSEATIGCCARFMDPGTPKENIGRPFANVSAYVVDTNLNVLIRGGIGELVIEGPLIGRGYHGRPDLTEKVFLEWPEKGRWSYRTGDLVRMMPDSTLEILGRIDTQIKLRGVRIESEGISSIIRKAAPASSIFALDASTVLAKHSLIGAEQLVSFVSWDPSVSVSIRKSVKPSVVLAPGRLLESVRHVCDIELPRYMKPSHIIPLSWLPLSSNGKSDAKSLIEIFHGLDIETLTSLMTSDNTVMEARLATQLEHDIFAVLVRHTAMPLVFPHPNVNVFECGLDSLAVIQFASDLTITFGKRVSALDIMLTPTLSAISSLIQPSCSGLSPGLPGSYVEEFSSSWKSEVYQSYPQNTVEDVLPPFSIQEGVLSRSANHETMYVQHVIIACKVGISLVRLRRAFQRVIERNPILRTVFHFSSALVQVVFHAAVAHPNWEQKETTLADARDFVQWFLEIKAASIAKVINETLSATPPLRICVYTSSGLTFVTLSIHHALFDGISLPLLMNEIEREYLEHTPGSPVSSSEILDQIASVDLEKARAFWINYFKGFSWPHKSLRLATMSPTMRYAVAFRSSLLTVKDLASSQKVTIQALLTCTFASLIANKIYGSDDVSFGVIRSGRLIPVHNIESAMAPMVSVVPTRVNFGLPGNILHGIQQNISAIVEFEHIPLGKVQNWVRPGQPLFDTLFSVSVKTNNASEIWEVLESEQPEADYMLSVEVIIDQDHNSLSVQAAWTEFNFGSDVIARLMEEFEDVVLKIGAGDHQMIGEEIKFSSQVAHIHGDMNESGEVIDVEPKTLQDLRRILSHFLGVDEHIVTDMTSLITLGLDSIKSVGLSRILRLQGYDVAANDLMKFSTLKKVGYHVTHPRVSSVDVRDQFFSRTLATLRASIPLGQFQLAMSDQISVFPTTALQAGMLSQTVNSQGALYVHVFPLQLADGVSVSRLREAWDQAVQTFTILRTSFHFITDTGTWVQAVHSQGSLQWTADTFRSESEYSNKVLAYLTDSQLKDEESLRRPPIYIRTFEPTSENSNQGTRFVLIMHHALYDGISLRKLFDSVKAMYTGSYTAVHVQFTDLLSHFIHQENTGAMFFDRVLQGYHPIHLPRRRLIRDTSNEPSSHIVSRNLVLDPICLEDLLRRTAVTLQCLGQAAWATLLGSLFETRDVVFGHVVSGRSIPGAEDVIGPVLNTIPCRVQLVEGMRNSELLKSIHQSNIDALPWQQASLRSIQKKLGVSSIWDSLFLFQPSTSNGSSMDIFWEFHGVEKVKIQYAINVEMLQVRSNSFTLNIACHIDCMMPDQLEDIIQAFQTLLESIVSQPDAPALRNIPLLKTITIIDKENSESTRDPATILSGTKQETVSIISIQKLLTSITNTPYDQITAITPLVALGIDSITAIQISSHFRRAGMKLVANDIVTSRTVGDLISRVRILVPGLGDMPPPKGHTPNNRIEIAFSEKQGILNRLGSNANFVERMIPASSGMKWLIGAWQQSNRRQFQHTFVYRLPAKFDKEKIRGAWMLLLQRLPLLRSTFACDKGGSEPRIVTFSGGHFEDWTEERVDDDNALLPVVLDRMREFVSSPPPTNRPPTRGAIFYSPHQCYFAMHLHHFQFDAWTLPLIIDDLSRLYLGVDTVTKNDLSSFLNEYASNPEYLETQREYWHNSFPHNFQPILLPPLVPCIGKERPSERMIYTSRAAINNAASCEEHARSLHVSLQAVFLACWAQIQGKYSAASFTTLGLWQAGRSGPIDDIASMVSPCSNIVPMYISGLENTGTIDLAKKIQDDLRARMAPVVQSDLVQVDAWVGGNGKPLCNVVVNIVRIAPDVTSLEGQLEQVELPYFIPGAIPPESDATLDRLPVTDLIQNDLIIDIATLPNENSVLMSFDAAAHIMDVRKAKELVDEWACAVVKALGIL
ncbi:peptide synthetase [Collybia nuda]|uniref:Peptide synthetase n=1 Tax=Collybia nuda TaxID=64659 RepID=A0A9P5Y729_9AGAR|nr:peptide synthetase [Collybia nuda]